MAEFLHVYQHGLMFTDMICHSRGDRERIELHTRKQSKSARWFEEHYGRLRLRLHKNVFGQNRKKTSHFCSVYTCTYFKIMIR